MIIHSGYSGEVLGQLEAWRQRLLEVGLGPDPPLPPKKTFVAKHGLPRLADYKKPAPRDFWEKFPSNRAEGKSGKESDGSPRPRTAQPSKGYASPA